MRSHWLNLGLVFLLAGGVVGPVQAQPCVLTVQVLQTTTGGPPIPPGTHRPRTPRPGARVAAVRPDRPEVVLAQGITDAAGKTRLHLGPGACWVFIPSTASFQAARLPSGKKVTAWAPVTLTSSGPHSVQLVVELLVP